MPDDPTYYTVCWTKQLIEGSKESILLDGFMYIAGKDIY